jgi:protein gp37
MGEATGISWADSTANLWVGCQKVSPACDHCYAEALMGDGPSDRMKRVHWGPDGDRQMVQSGWADIKRWNDRAAKNGGVDPDLGRRRRVFVNSLSDFFDNHRSVKWRGDAWALIKRSPHVIFMLVTKRPQLIARVLPPYWDDIAERVWLLTTAEDQEWYERRVPDLLASTHGHQPAAVYGVSCEPLLGPIDLRGWPLDWVIAGGESGKDARPCDPAWVEGLRFQCAQAQIPFHFKQWGEWAPVDRDSGDIIVGVQPMKRLGKTSAGHGLMDGRTVQEVPHAA